MSFAQTPPSFSQFQPQQTNQVQTRQYNEDLIQLAGFSFPFNNLLLVSLMKRVPRDSSDQKEVHFGFVTAVLGVGANNNRTYDFNQKIVQKFSLKDLQSLTFTLKQLALSNTRVLPFTKFTNSGSGSKTLYLQYKEDLENFNNSNNTNAQQQFQTQQSSQRRGIQSSIVLGSSFGNLKINIPLSKPDAYSIADIIEKLYLKGIELEIQHQINSNKSRSDLSPNNKQEMPVFGGNAGFQVPTVSPVMPDYGNQLSQIISNPSNRN